MFEGISYRKFNLKFKCEDDCRQYLLDLKWKNGYKCFHCGHDKYWTGRTAFHRRCKQCDYDESVCSNTVFHKIKFPLLKAFGIAFQIVVPKKGRSTIDLAKEYDVNKKTAAAFRKKIQHVMQNEEQSKNDSGVNARFVLDSITITHRGESLNGFQRIELKLKCEKSHKKNAKILNCKAVLPDPDLLSVSYLLAGKFKMPGASILIWNLKVWLTGMHHHCSFQYLTGYLDEFFFRYNNRGQCSRIWHNLIERAVAAKHRNFSVSEP